MNNEKLIYLDNAATTMVCPHAILACVQAMKDTFGNPSSLYSLGFHAEKLVKDAKETVLSELGLSDQGNLYFTASATEANNIALFGGYNAAKRERNTVISFATHHPSVKLTVEELEKLGADVISGEPDENGIYDPEKIEAVLSSLEPTDYPAIFTMISVNNETGAVCDVPEIARIVKKHFPKTLIHVDLSQSFCKLNIDLSDVDLVTISGHKAYAPKGVGGLFVRNGVRISPIMFGGDQQDGIRPGTESVSLIAAFAAAIQYCAEQKRTAFENAAELNKHLRERLSEMDGVVINSAPPKNSSPYILNFSLLGAKSENVIHTMEAENIFISAGSACSRGKTSHVLAAMGITDKARLDGSLRISLAFDTTMEDVDAFLVAIRQIIEKYIKTGIWR